MKQREVLEKYWSGNSQEKVLEEKGFAFYSQVSDSDFEETHSIIEQNVFNKLGIRKEDYFCIKK